MIGARNAHDGAAAGAGLDPERALELEEAERLPDGGTCHSELLHHPMLGVELRARPQAPAPDLAHELPGDANGGAFLGPLCPHAVDAPGGGVH